MNWLCAYIVWQAVNVWTQVPDAVKSQYQNPPSMLLPAGVRQLELVCSGVPDRQPSKHRTTEAEQQEVGGETFLSPWHISDNLSKTFLSDNAAVCVS